MKLLITGGAGFIGSHLCEQLIRFGHEVRILDNFCTGKPENLAGLTHGITVTCGDIRDRELLQSLAKGVDGIFHEAALVSVAKSIEDPALCFENNALGSFNVFEAARRSGVRRVVFASSAAVYGLNQALPLKEPTPLLPLSPYGNDKLYSEQLGRLYHELYGLEAVPLRYFNVFGPRQDPSSPYSGVLSIFMQRLLEGQDLTIFGDGEQTRDFVYVEDVVQANLRAMFGKYQGFQPYNVGTGRRVSLNQVIEILSDISGGPITPRYRKERPGDIRHSQADIRAIQDALGYQPRWELRLGLQKLWEDVSRK